MTTWSPVSDGGSNLFLITSVPRYNLGIVPGSSTLSLVPWPSQWFWELLDVFNLIFCLLNQSQLLWPECKNLKWCSTQQTLWPQLLKVQWVWQVRVRLISSGQGWVERFPISPEYGAVNAYCYEHCTHLASEKWKMGQSSMIQANICSFLWLCCFRCLVWLNAQNNSFIHLLGERGPRVFRESEMFFLWKARAASVEDTAVTLLKWKCL